MKEITIKSIYGRVAWTGQAESIRDALEKATVSGANLRGAYLTDADLSGVDFSGAYLRGANLAEANLTEADLTGADLSGVYLRGANLRGAKFAGADLAEANLRGADFTDADLTGADLTDANLTDANLTGADLTDANLTDANLTGADLRGVCLTGVCLTGADLTGADIRGAKGDVDRVLVSAPAEVPGLLAILRGGLFDGRFYDRECACLVGSIAKIRGVAHDAMPELRPDGDSPAERWAMAIREGDTPANNPVSAITVGWIEEWLKAQGREVPPHRPIVWRGDAGAFARELVDAIGADKLGEVLAAMTKGGA